MITPADIGLPAKFSSFREYPGFSQWETAAQLARCERRIRGICAPPGAGKSLLNFTVSRILDSSRVLYLTITKGLQNQLMNDFADSEVHLFNLVGHSSYPCTSKLYDDSGDITSLECSEKRESCAYWQDVKISLSRSSVVTNYANWISIARAGDSHRFGKFDLLICDEAHNLESLICDLLAIKLSQRGVYSIIGRGLLPATSPLSEWISWAREALPLSERALSESQRLDRLKGDRESNLTKQIKRLISHLETILSIQDEWVSEATETGVKLTPVFAPAYIERYLFRGIPNIILSSATLTPQDFCYLGISTDDYTLLDIASGFPVGRRPFYYIPTVEIDHRIVEGQIIQAVNRMDRIISARADRKGIIHSVSYDHAVTIQRYSSSKIRTHDKRNALREIRSFMQDKSPGVLASPTIAEGFDFEGDKARFQFIWKVPLADSRNPLIAARKKRYSKYAYYLAGKTILQQYGRIVRYFSDWGETFILDKNWSRYMMRAIDWPAYFRAAWQTTRDLPNPLTLN